MKNRSVKFIFIVLVLCLAAATLAMGAFASGPDGPADPTTSDTTEESPAATYTITCAEAEHGAVTVSTTAAAADTTITVYVHPDPGYELNTLTVKEAELNESNNTFTMPASDVTITATFKVAEYSVTATAGANGSITVSKPSNGSYYYYGELVTVTVTPDDGYYLKSLTVGGDPVYADYNWYYGYTCSFYIYEDTTVSATFTDELTVSVSYNGYGNYGTAAVSGDYWQDDEFDYGETVYIECYPEDGYAVDEITVTDLVTGRSIAVSESFYEDYFYFTMPEHPVRVYVKFIEGEYKVNVEKSEHGTVSVDIKNASEDDRVTITVKPDKDYKLTWLYVKGEDGTSVSYSESPFTENTYYFYMPDQDVTITAIFGYAYKDLPFTDVHSWDWFYEPVQFVYTMDIMNGVTSTSFAPDSNITRGMVVTMLWRLAGEPYVGGGSFDDVAANEYYSTAVAWSAKNNIVNGVTDSTFGVNTDITREQLAVILYRYAKSLGYSTTGGSLIGYSDASSISDYAKDAMAWAVKNEIITGVTYTRLNPTGNATRAAVAQMFMNFYAYIN